MVTKSIEGTVEAVDELVDLGKVDEGLDDGDGGEDGREGREAIIPVGTGRVFKRRSASVIRARIFSMPREREVALTAA